MSQRPVTTLFLLTSIDGKISTGSTDELDFDQDLPKLDGTGTGLAQYYALEEETDNFSLNSGKAMAKIGWNEKKANIEELPVSFIIVDNQPHLTEQGVYNLITRTEHLYIVTTNKHHPAFDIKNDKLSVQFYDNEIDFEDLLDKASEWGAARLTIQSGGTLNTQFLRHGLIDRISIVIAPVAVGGTDTPGLFNGPSLTALDDLTQLRALRLTSVNQLKDSYLHLTYEVLNT